MLKLFVSSSYHIRHSEINEQNIYEKLKDDMRSQLLGDVKKFVYASPNVPLKENSNLLYVGGFYYEEPTEVEYEYGECENVVRAELKQIDESDLVVVSLLQYSAIATVTELMYAAQKKKKIVIFCHPEITQFKTESEYWFPIISALTLDWENIEIRFVENEKEIIDFINQYKEVSK